MKGTVFLETCSGLVCSEVIVFFTSHAIDWICSVKLYCSDKCSVKAINVDRNDIQYMFLLFIKKICPKRPPLKTGLSETS